MGLRNFTAVLIREVEMFSSHKTFSRLSVGLPVFMFIFFLLLFKSGVPRDMPVAVFDQDRTALSRQLIRMIDATPSARVAYRVTDMSEAERMMKEGKADAIVQIPQGLEQDIYGAAQAHVLAYINGLNLIKSGLLNRDVQAATFSFSTGVQIQTLMKQGLSETEAKEKALPLYYESHTLFNPYVNYGYYLLPTFLPLMLMLFILLTTIFTIGVELKNGTARGWSATAGGNAWVALLGKLTPYTLIFWGLCLLMDTMLFKFLGTPLRGNTAMIFVSGLIYVLAIQSVGIFLIVLFSNMRLSLSIGGGYSVLAFTFSGLTFPFMAMDGYIHILGYMFPLTFYMEVFIDQAMRGAPVADSTPWLGYMLLFLLPGMLMIPRLRKICLEEKYWGRA